MPRRLLSTSRQVALDRLDEYLLHWDAVRRVARQHGGGAWLFRAAGRDDCFLEFLEWEDGEADGEPALPERAAVAGALAALNDAFSGGRTEAWEEAL